jgi:transposase
MQNNNNTELSSPEGTRGEFNGRPSTIKLGIDVHQAFYVVVVQEGGSNPRPAQRFGKGAFLVWARRLKEKHAGAEIHAVYEACGFGFGLERALSALGIHCQVVCPQKLDERQERVKTDGRDARTLCLKLSRYVEGNKEELAVVRVPSEKEEQARAIHRQREQLVRARKQLEAHGRSLLVNHGCEPVNKWWKKRTFATLAVPAWLKDLLGNTQPLLLQIEAQIRALSVELQAAAAPGQPRGLGALTSVVIDREVCAWERFRNRRQIGSYTGLCPGEHSSGKTRLQSCVTKHGNPRLRAALVELAWRMVRFQPEYRAVVKWRRILAKGALATGAARKKAIVAVARQLAVDLWRIRTGRVKAEALGLKD